MSKLIQDLKLLELKMRDHLPADVLNEFRLLLLMAELENHDET
jgi:hypothetical protein